MGSLPRRLQASAYRVRHKVERLSAEVVERRLSGAVVRVLGVAKGCFLSIQCKRKFPSNAHAGFNRMHSATCIGWKSPFQSDAPPHFNPLHFRVSIH